MKTKIILFLAALLAISTPRSAKCDGGGEPAKAALIQEALARVAGSLGWSPEIMVSAEADGSTSYLVMGNSGMAAIYAYGSESESAAAFENSADGEKSAFHGYPSTGGENAGMTFRIWRAGRLMFSIMDESGTGAGLLFSCAVKQGVITGDEQNQQTEGSWFEEDFQKENISISGIEQWEKVISVRLTGKGLQQGVVVQGELKRVHDKTTIQRGATVVLDDGSATLHFRAPYMGWTPGQYTVHVRAGAELEAGRDVEIPD